MDDPVVDDKATILPFEGEVPEAPAFLPEQTTIAIPDPFDLSPDPWSGMPQPLGDMSTIMPAPAPFEPATPTIPDPFDLRPDHWSGLAPDPEVPLQVAPPRVRPPFETTNPALRYLVHPFGKHVVEPGMDVASRLWNLFDRTTDLAEKAAFPFQAADPSAAPPAVINTPKGWNNYKQIAETPIRALVDPQSVSRARATARRSSHSAT